MESVLKTIYSIIWGPALIYGILLVGIIYTVLTRFVQVRLIKDSVKLMFAGEKSASGVSSFEALSMALSGRVGTGNIIGTASAIAFGGPGAIFWMWVTAFIGAATAFIESTLAQVYKEESQGVYRGGPAYYIEKGTGQRWFGLIFAFTAIMATAFLMTGVQANAISSATQNAFGIAPWVTGLALVIILGFIIFGGVRRIARAATLIVPFMAVVYIAVALIIIAMHITEVPAVFSLIISSAFGVNSVFGGLLGSAIAWGVKRAIFSNEAGQGNGAHPAAAAEVSHPAKQGLVQSFSVYIDTILVCSATAFMILFMGTYNVQEGSDTGAIVVENIPNQSYTEYTQVAVDTAFSGLQGFGSAFVAIALFFFAFTTIMSYYYISETNVAYIMGERDQRFGTWVVKIIVLAATFLGTVRTADMAWLIGDIGLGLMVWVNVIGMLILTKPALIVLKDYERQKKEGKDPSFDPRPLGIKEADFWTKDK
ncbi:alanine/glycine:cation symporter family protein [Metalysinibacillus jejuensis]|uniref:alanine/glycine:cation symporter family protein n=1 Tax=Metalysinibacillus jejuensis TaxID=914327 RepID=UPI000D3980BD|nr:alanine/glycine:cation symporter family protein [Metalysinibacillus jejuensis]